jgi:hypothetical protein
MRQQAKPFTVEIKKSRKSASDHQPLFGFLEEAAARESVSPAARLFDGHNGQNGHNGHNGHNGDHNGTHRADVGADVARVFGTPQVQQPANRILPDLTAKPVVAEAEEEAPRQRRPRIAKSKAPRIPKPKPLPVTVHEPVAHQEVRAAPAPVVRVHRRPKDEGGLGRAERWKRRLPRFAR